MIKNFGNKMASDLFHTGITKKLPIELCKRAVHLLEIMEAVEDLEDLKEEAFPPNIRLHMLHGDRKGDWAIDINKLSGWRITFRFKEKVFENVKIENYH